MYKILALFLILFTSKTLAIPYSTKDSLQGKSRSRYIKEKKIIPIPVLFRLPETGFGGGALASVIMRFSRDSAGANPTQISLSAAYTQKQQILLYLPFLIYLNNNKYYINGEIAWYRYNYRYFGVGENEVPEEIYGAEYPRIRLLAMKYIGKSTYAGIRYLYENYRVTETEAGKELASGRVVGSQQSITSGIGISLLKDSRDAIYYPRKGIFAEVYAMPSLKAFGADRNFNRVVFDVAKYQSLSKKVVWASHFYGSFMQGNDIPFSQLSLLGGSKRKRGTYDGRFRDKNAFLIQSEARFEVWKFVGFTAFGSVAWLGNEDSFMRFSYPKFAYGAGLRLTAIKKEHINLRIDYALVPKEKGNFYLTVGEAF